MAESKDTIKSTLETIGRIIAPITVITALLYYFGWIRTGAIFGRFGVDQRVLAYSVDDYLLRSAGVAFRPLAFLLLGVATSIAIWYGLTRIANRPKLVRPIAVLLFTLATGLVIYGVAVLFDVIRVSKPLWAAVALAIGVIAAELASSLLNYAGTAPGDKTVLARRLLLGAGLLVALFWSTAIYAQISGDRFAAIWASNPRRQPSVTILSEKDLKLSGPGIVAARLSSDGEGFQYEYSGLRLLIYSNSRWILYPDSWNSDPLARVIVLRDESTVRIEMRPTR
jgi:hypothetical protein